MLQLVQSKGEFPSPKSWCEVVDIELCRRIYYSHPGAGLIFNFKNHEGIKFVCVWDGEATHADGTRLWQFSAFRKNRSLALRTVYVRQVPQAGLHMVLQCKLEIRAGAEDSNFVMNFTSMSGNSFGKAVHELNTLPHRVNVQYVRHLAKERASDAGKLASRNQSVHLVLEGFAAPLGDLIVLWKSLSLATCGADCMGRLAWPATGLKSAWRLCATARR